MKLIQIMFCGIILAVLAIPGWLTIIKPLTGKQIKNSVTEQRRLVQFEQIGAAWPDIKSTVQTFGRAFDDQLFARTEILQTVNGVLVNKAGHSTADSIVFGEDGYRFFMRRKNAKAFIQIPCAVPGGLDADKRQITIDNYIAFARRMQAKGVETRLVIIPTKSSIYPEKLPKEVHAICVGQTPSAMDAVNQIKAAGLNARYDLNWFRSENAAETFHPQSFHWVSTKSHIYAQFLYNNDLSALGGKNLPSYQEKPFQISAQADISRHLGIRPNEELFHGTKYVWPNLDISRPAEFNKITGKSELLRKLDKSVSRYASHKTYPDTKLLMVGDSFSDELFAYWASRASEAIFMNDTRAAYRPVIIDETVSTFEADIVVFVIEESKFAPIKTDNFPYPFATKLLPPE